MTKITITLFKDPKLTKNGFGALIESESTFENTTSVVICPYRDPYNFVYKIYEAIKTFILKLKNLDESCETLDDISE